MRVTAGYARIAHHGAHSGYWQLIPALRRHVPVQWVDGERGSPLPEAVSRRLVDGAALDWYDARSLAVEVGVARALLRWPIASWRSRATRNGAARSARPPARRAEEHGWDIVARRHLDVYARVAGLTP